jgi:EmrB/QacA subfamily drug resistance transporter
MNAAADRGVLNVLSSRMEAEMNPQPRLWWTFAITSLALFAFALDRLVVAVALPAIRTDLSAQAADLEWTVNAYTLSFAVLLLTGGALGDRFGRRRMFTIGVAVFTAGSAAAALAPTIGTLVAARALQGVGGALFSPLTLTMLSAVTPSARRGAVLGAWGGIGGLGAALGPLAGGALAGSVGWRAIFWLNVPLGLLLMALGRLRLAETYGPRRKLDLAGVVLGSAGLFGVVWAVIRIGVLGWASTEVPLALGGGVVLLVLFVNWEMRAPTPMLPMRFFRDRVFATGGLASLMMYSALFGALFLITQLLQVGLGATPLQAGLRMLPMAVMPMLLAPVGGIVADRIGFRPLMICGLAMEAIALGWLAAAVTPTVSYGFLVPPLVLAGTGSAVFFAPLASAMLSAVPAEEHGQASGAATAIRELAVVFGVAVLGLVFAGHGGYASRANFVDGFVPAMWLAAGLATVGVLAAVALPRDTAVRGLTDPLVRCENDADGAVPAGAARGAADARHGRRAGQHGAWVSRTGAR